MITLNEQELERAVVAYELAYPVRVRLLDGGPQGIAGKYHGIGRFGPATEERLEIPAHHITVDSGLNGSFATTTLLHELMHAKQNERFLPDGFQIQNDDDYRQANIGLREAFRDEMREIRRRHNLGMALTHHYQDVSFEVEARSTSKLTKDFDLFHDDGVKPKSNGVPSAYDLVDEHGRFTWRVDLWAYGKWDKELKKTPKTFRGTYYVVAKDEWKAKEFARKEYGTTGDDAQAYLILPLDYKEDEGVVAEHVV